MSTIVTFLAVTFAVSLGSLLHVGLLRLTARRRAVRHAQAVCDAWRPLVQVVLADGVTVWGYICPACGLTAQPSVDSVAYGRAASAAHLERCTGPAGVRLGPTGVRLEVWP